MNPSSSFVHDLLRRLQEQAKPRGLNGPSHPPKNGASDGPDLDVDFLSHSTPQAFQLGTGASIFTQTLIPAITAAKSEVIFVTCFWAPSKTLTALHHALTTLASHRHQHISQNNGRTLAPLRIRVCLSSRSLLQKLLHPQFLDGYVYPPSSWQKDLGLPDPALLEAGKIELLVKSLFFLPFSVMHPKFVIIDRQRAFVPSCNVSWEAWLEGCVEVNGDAVHHLMSFFSSTWERHLDAQKPLQAHNEDDAAFDARPSGLALIHSPAHISVALPTAPAPVPTLVLPSHYHQNPHFRPFPWQKTPKPPATPLNLALLDLFGQARSSIYIQTPNLTCETVIAALLDALIRGVHVTIVTSRNMMVLEQLLTAGTTTSWCIRSLVRRYAKLEDTFAHTLDDVETDQPRLGHLSISYFRPRRISRASGFDGDPLATTDTRGEEPVHSHLKLTIVDGEYTVLGSGNMDRASWYTSQELGILFQDTLLAAAVRASVEKVLDARLHLVFDSAES